MILEAFTALHSGAFLLLSYMATFEIFTRYAGDSVVPERERGWRVGRNCHWEDGRDTCDRN